MTASGKFAPKLMIVQVHAAEFCLNPNGELAGDVRLGSLEFDRVWLQAEVADIAAEAVLLNDTTGQIEVHLQPANPFHAKFLAEVKVGDYVCAIGQVQVTTYEGSDTPEIILEAHQVAILPDAEQRRQLWQSELTELQSKVYGFNIQQ
ncbi:hypothetical protein WJX72_007653 [[Myrmecia] bisecta]|uniref:Uncharacterized protein n=1 Tax=[Myrmecia] bisecta TaxID=41462 RepID=A0AAW1R7G9_9CHLO